MSIRALLLGFVTVAFVAGCKESSPVPHTPTHLMLVSGANQSGDVSAALSQPLVVQALDGADRSVSGVPITWTVTGDGSISAATATTDTAGKASVIWTLSPSAGVQVVTATSTQITGAGVNFVANNGAIITGTVSAAGGNPFAASFARTVSRTVQLGSPRAVTRHPSPNRVIIGFRNDVLGVPAAASGAYRSLSMARQTSGLLAERVASLAQSYHIGGAVLSPALLAARVTVQDTLQIDALMQSLRADPNVAWVERDEIVSIRDGAPRAMSAELATKFAAQASGGAVTATSRLPNDPSFFAQYWPANMLDLPRAWSITTGSASVTVAVVDMGIRFDHPDIAANLTNDGYDFVSQVGYGSVQNNCDGSTFTTIDGDGDGPDPDPTDPDDLEFDTNNNCWARSTLGDHGLWTAGIIGAVGNDGAGTSGVNWTVRIRPVRVLGITGDGTDFDIAQGILYAAGLAAPGANGALVQTSRAPIINMSLGGPIPSTAMATAISAASNAGSLIVASAGNDGLDIPVYPAGFSNVMAVASVGEDGTLATYSNGGTFVSVAAPGGDFRFDDNGGGGVLGPGWDFVNKQATYLFGYGTSASAPYVSGIAALLLAQTPGLSATALRQRIEQYATRPAGMTRSDVLGWGIVNAYNALTQQNGPTRRTLVRLINATTGASVRTVTVSSTGMFALTQLPQGAYYLQAGDDENGDGAIGVPGRRFGWAGGFGAPSVFNVNGNAQAAAIALGLPTEVEPNDDVTHANMLSVGSYVVGNITTPDMRDMYSVTIPAAGMYTFETSGLVGSCGYGIELDTFLTVATAAGVVVGSNDDFSSATSRACSRVQATLSPGIYYVTVTGVSGGVLASHGRYRLEVRSGG